MIDIYTKFFNPEILYIVEGCIHPSNKTSFHAHESIEMTIVLSGEAELIIDQSPYHLKKGDIALINPSTQHIERNPFSQDVRMLHIGLHNLQFIGYEANYFPSQSPILQLIPFTEKIIQISNDILIELKSSSTFKDLALKIKINELWLLILRASQENLIVFEPINASLVKKEQMIEEIKYFIESNYSKELTLESISQFMYLSPTYLSKLFKEETNDTPINYLISTRMQQAKRLLKDTELSIKQVAKEVGYDDPLYFSKLFKKNIGTSPSYYSQLKKQLLN